MGLVIFWRDSARWPSEFLRHSESCSPPPLWCKLFYMDNPCSLHIVYGRCFHSLILIFAWRVLLLLSFCRLDRCIVFFFVMLHVFRRNEGFTVVFLFLLFHNCWVLYSEVCLSLSR